MTRKSVLCILVVLLGFLWSFNSEFKSGVRAQTTGESMQTMDPAQESEQMFRQFNYDNPSEKDVFTIQRKEEQSAEAASFYEKKQKFETDPDIPTKRGDGNASSEPEAPPPE